MGQPPVPASGLTDADLAVLDDPVGASLRTRHAGLARRHGRALGYLPEVATFVALPADPEPGDWADLATLLGPGGFADLFSSPAAPPPDWRPVFTLEGLQMVGPPPADDGPPAGPDVVTLGEADRADMLGLAALTRPGPFWRRTPEMGRYVGIRHEGRLVAMAGERLRPSGWTEVSAVCTAPDARGRGLAGQVVHAVLQGVAARGDRAFLHVAADNAAAIALYERLGLSVRRAVTFRGFRVPE